MTNREGVGNMANSSGSTLSRRTYLKSAAAAATAGIPWRQASPTDTPPPRTKSVAVVATVYRPGSHADVLVGKILNGWKQDGGPGPALHVASMYIDQFPKDDLARQTARQHQVPIVDTIDQAVTLGNRRISVDGVISIGEHGNYPVNARGQRLYPRRRFFEEITNAFRKYDQVVPVFSDKHLGPVWSDAKWMYDRARQLRIPFMAGSSLPVSFRKPQIEVPLGCRIESAVGVGYDGLDIYGSHALDCYQSLVERRRGAETGVEWVQFLEGRQVSKAVDDIGLPRQLLKAAKSVVPSAKISISPGQAPREGLFLFQYRDGLLGALFMLQTVNRISVAVQLEGHAHPHATQFEERSSPRYPHFAYLLKAIERMIHTGKSSYPVERTLLTSGILDRGLRSRALSGQRLMTPELSIRYQPVDYPHAPHPPLTSSPLAIPAS